MRHFAITGIVTAARTSSMRSIAGHARDAAFPPDVGGHALERHHGRGAGVLGDAGLLGRR